MTAGQGGGPLRRRGAARAGIAGHYRLTVLFGRLIGRAGRNGLPVIRSRSTGKGPRDRVPNLLPTLRQYRKC